MRRRYRLCSNLTIPGHHVAHHPWFLLELWQAAAKARMTLADIGRNKSGVAAFRAFIERVGGDEIAPPTKAKVRAAELPALRSTQLRAYKAVLKLQAHDADNAEDDQYLPNKAQSIVEKFVWPKRQSTPRSNQPTRPLAPRILF
jgi:hypothetical protein